MVCWRRNTKALHFVKQSGALQNKSIPFIKIANRVEVNVSLKWKRISGPPPIFEQ